MKKRTTDRNSPGASLTRRSLLKSATAAGAAFSLTDLSRPRAGAAQAASMMGVPFEKRDIVRLGIIGVGGRGLGMLREWLAVPNLQVTAICDIDKAATARAVARIEKAGQKAPAVYSAGERDYENLCKRDDVDFIYIATPWDWHAPMAVAAMKNGKHCGLEVPATITIDECWEIVNTSEQTRRHCMIMENCCYGQSELLVLNIVKAGLLGQLIHGEAAYNHDLRFIVNENRSEGLWRRIPHTKRNGNLYPTHGLGPVSNYMSVNRGDYFAHMVSMSSPALGLDEYRAKHEPKDSPKWKEKYICGDMNTSIIKTAQGRTIVLQHNITTPRPYDRINLIQGTRGIFRDYPERIYIEAAGRKDEEYESLAKYKAQYEHALWKAAGEMARKNGGHGGMDYIMVYRVVECFRQGLAPDMDVYDAALWSAPGPLSEQSVAQGSMPVKFPDFTRGKWSAARPVMA
ncbi:MAG: Gfo/Idh/MocA family oxidoreductase [Blastocatellia bacterium]|nr:Gfo/Idh/MocA family oxidoreductase [Blastocatellia bacterium]